MLDAVIDYLPSPLDVPAVPTAATPKNGDGHPQGRRSTSRSPPWRSRSCTDPFFGKLTYFRVYSGKLETGARRSSTRPRTRRSASARIFQMHANNREDRSTRSTPATSYAVIGLKDTTTGDTLCDPDQPGRPRVDDVPRARSSRSPSSPRPRPTRKSSASATQQPRRRGPDLPGPHRRGDRPDRHRAAWASCTSTSSSTA